MNQEESLLSIINYLDKNQIEYFITGSFASNLHGVPRMTQDADIVIQTSLNKLLKMAKDLAEDFYISEEAIQEAVKEERMFNVIHLKEGYKFDLIPLKRGGFDQSNFSRRAAIDWKGKKVYFSSAEDIILSKLKWSKESDSDRQLEDAEGVIEVQGDELNWSYLESWSKKLGLQDLLKKIKHVPKKR